MNYELRMKNTIKSCSCNGRWSVLRGTCEDAAGGDGENGVLDFLKFLAVTVVL